MNVWQIITSPFRWAKVAFEVLPVGVNANQPIYPKTNYINNAKDGYSKNEIIYSCITYKTDSMAQVDMVAEDSEGDILDNHPLSLLVEHPNPFNSQLDLMTMILTDLDLYGKAYIEKVRSGSGQVVGLYRLRPDYVRPVPTKEKFIDHWEYDPNTGQKVLLPFEDIMEFKLFDPLNMYHGQAPVSVASRVGDVDNGGVDYLESFYKSGCMPAGYLSTEMPVNDKQAAIMQKDWTRKYGGVKNWRLPAILGNKASYIKTGSTLDEMATDKIDAKTISRICMVLKVSPILIGAAHGLAKSTFNNYSTARLSFWREGLQPRLKRVLSDFNRQLASEFTGVMLAWNFAEVPALQEDTDKVWTRNGKAYNDGLVTLNEARSNIGLEDVGDDGNSFKVESVVEVVTDGEDKSACGCGKHHLSEGDQLLAELALKQMEMKVAIAPDESDRERREAETQSSMEKFFRGQEKRVMKTVGKKDGKFAEELKDLANNLKHIKGLSENNDDYILQRDKEIEIWLKAVDDYKDTSFWFEEAGLLGAALTPEIINSGILSVVNTIEAFEAAYDIGIPIDLANQATVKWARKYSATLVKGITKTTRNATIEAIAAWVETDEPRSALVDQLSALFGDTRARLIARTETTKAFFEGNRITWKTSGIVKSWKWRTTESACPICGPLEGEVFPITSSVGIPDSSHPNCNCFAEAVIDQAALAVA